MTFCRFLQNIKKPQYETCCNVLECLISKRKATLITKSLPELHSGVYQVAVPSQSDLYEALKPLDDSCYWNNSPAPQDTNATEYIALRDTRSNLAISARSTKVVLQLLSDEIETGIGSRLHYSVIQEGIAGG